MKLIDNLFEILEKKNQDLLSIIQEVDIDGSITDNEHLKNDFVFLIPSNEVIQKMIKQIKIDEVKVENLVRSLFIIGQFKSIDKWKRSNVINITGKKITPS